MATKKQTKKQKQKKVSAGTKKLVDNWKKTGKMKTSRATYKPKSKKDAIKQALAIEYGKEGLGRAGKKGK